MKLLIICCFFVAFVSAIEQEKYKLPAERLQAVIDKVGKPCAQKHNVDPALYISKVADGTIPRDEIGNDFLYCFAFNGGYIYETGHINIDKLAGILGENHPRLEDMKEALRKCDKITKEDHLQTTVAMNQCIVDTAPVRFVFDF